MAAQPSFVSDSHHHCQQQQPFAERHGDYGTLQHLVDTDNSTRAAPRSCVNAALDTLFFTRGTRIYEISQQRARDVDDVLELQPQDTTRVCVENFLVHYETHSHSVLRAILLTFGRLLFACSLGQLLSTACAIFAPVVLQHVVLAFSTTSGAVDKTNLYAWLAVFLASRLVNALVATQVSYGVNIVGLRITATIRSTIFQKVMRKRMDTPTTQTSERKKEVDVMNLTTADTRTLQAAVLSGINLLTLPIQIAVTTYLLYSVLDVAAFAGVAVIIGTLLLNYGISKLMTTSFSKLMKIQDQRMKIVKELFGVIQIVKFNAWEDRFKTKLLAERALELEKLAAYSYAGAVSTFVLWSSPLVVSTVTFAVYALVLKQTLTAAKVFTAMALFNALRDPLRDLPATIQLLIQSRVSIARLDRFLKSPEVDINNVIRCEYDPSPGSFAVEVTKGQFAWSSASSELLECAGFVLTDIEFRVKSDDLVVIYGGVGAGKSSLCSALLGEMNKMHGTVEVRGRVAYYSQQPWIQNMSIRDNILFGTAFDAERYNAVLDACCLRDDLEQFPSGDATEIGEKGVNLSGGQKARVSLARACYADADVYILDSPLAAVDTVVQKAIFEKCICGLLSDKTIFLVTHNPEIIASSAVSYRIGLENGAMKENTRVDGSGKRRAMLALSSLTSETIDIAKPSSKPKTQHGGGVLIHKEHREEGKVSSAVWWRYLNAIGGVRMVAILLLSQLLWQGFQVASDFWLSHWTGRRQGNNGFQEANLNYFIETYAGLAAAGATMVLVRGVIVTSMGLQASRYLFAAMSEGLLRSPLRFFDANPIGRIINRYAGDIYSVDLITPLNISMCMSAFFTVGCSLVTATFVIKYTSLCLLPVVYLYIQTVDGYVRTFRDIRRLMGVAVSPILSHTAQSEQGMTTIRAFGAHCVQHAVLENQRRIDVNNALWYTETVMIQWFALRMQFLGASVLLVVVASFVVFSDMFSPGLVGLAFTYALNIDASLLTLMKTWSKAENSMVNVERVLEYSSLEQEGRGETASLLLMEPHESWPVRGEITFDSVAFNYKPHDPLVLKNVSFSIQSHEKIGIVGRTGAGKSSLTMALFRMNELLSGHILIDGVDIAALPLRVLRSRMSIIPQSPVLLEGSLRDFVDPFGDFQDDEILDMLDHVELLTKLRKCVSSSSPSQSTESLSSSEIAVTLDHPDASVLGLQLSANGENFSVGERQMMCMARALLKRSSIVIMDEATAAMDHATETKVSAMIRRELKHVTLLTIAHRLATVMDSDRILVLSDGQVVEFDTPENLLQNPRGVFFGLVQDAKHHK
ncbi:Atp-binding protein, partial [Globisporangium splendens]